MVQNSYEGKTSIHAQKNGGLIRHALSLPAFVKLQKATISFVMSARPSVRTEQLGSLWTDFHEI